MFLPQSGLWLTRSSVSQFMEIKSRGMLCLTWMECLTYTILFWWNLSSASIDRVIFNFLTMMNACVIGFAGHSILAFSINIPISVIVSFKCCMTSDSDVSLWNPVITALPWFWSPCAPLGSSLLFSHFSSMSRIFFSIFMILSLICLSAEICPSSRRFFLGRFPSFLRIRPQIMCGFASLETRDVLHSCRDAVELMWAVIDRIRHLGPNWGNCCCERVCCDLIDKDTRQRMRERKKKGGRRKRCDRGAEAIPRNIAGHEWQEPQHSQRKRKSVAQAWHDLIGCIVLWLQHRRWHYRWRYRRWRRWQLHTRHLIILRLWTTRKTAKTST